MSAEPARRLILPRLGRRLLQDFSIALVFLMVVAVLTVLDPRFLNPRNLSNILQQVSMVGIIAMGMTLLLISGNFDLSVGGQVALISVAAALAINSYGLGAGVLTALVLGTVCGTVNAVLVTRLRVNSLVATLGSGLSFGGLAFVVSGNQPIVVQDQSLQGLVTANLAGVPVSVVCFALVVVVATWFLHFTVGGREFYAVGANPEAARYAGLRIGRVRVLGFIVTGALCALSALILTGLLNTGLPGAAASWPLDVIAGTVVGGVSIAGGRGSSYMAVLGVVLIGVVHNGFNLLNLDPNLYNVLTGVIIVLAVALDGALQRSARAALSRANRDPALTPAQVASAGDPDGLSRPVGAEREGGGS